VYETIGGAGGGAFSLISRHVDIDGLISANGNAPDDRFDTGAGRCPFVILQPEFDRIIIKVFNVFGKAKQILCSFSL
jgi:hypothetical protein